MADDAQQQQQQNSPWGDESDPPVPITDINDGSKSMLFIPLDHHHQQQQQQQQ